MLQPHFSRRLVAAICGVVLLYALAAAGKEFVKPAAQKATTYAAHDQHSNESVTVAVEPYDAADKAEIFSVNYKELDMLPFLVVITNDGDQPVTLSQMQVRLVTGSRAKLSAATSDDLYRRLSHPSARTTSLPLPIPLPGKKVKGNVSTKQLNEIQSALFSAKAVEPHNTQSGFVFFDITGVSRPLAGSHFYLDGARDSKGNELLYFDVALDKSAASQP